MKVLLILLGVLIISCTPQKRIQKIISKNPDLAKTIIKDTLITFSTKSVDTVMILQLNNSTDTFIIKDTKTRIYRYLDTLKVIQEPVKDSVKVNTVTQVINAEKDYRLIEYILEKFLMWVLIIVLVSIIFSRNGRTRN